MPDNLAAKPRRILLATDLSARSDRPLDRALALARVWDAELIVAHVCEPESEVMLDQTDPFFWQQWPARDEEMRERVRRSLGDAGGGIKVVIEHGAPAERITSIVEREQADLVVTGVARAATLGRTLLGATVQRLVRAAHAPVLVVKQRASGEYRDILAPFDFSDASAHAVGSAAALFPDARLTLLHGYDMPFLLYNSREAFADYLRKAEQEEAEAFVAKSAPDPETRKRIEVLIQHGDPVRLAQAYISEKSPDLTVIASHGRSAMYELAIGSTASKMLDRLDSDILLVRRPANAT